MLCQHQTRGPIHRKPREYVCSFCNSSCISLTRLQCFGNPLHGPQTVSQTRATLGASVKSLETDPEQPSRTLLRCAPHCRLLLAATLFLPHAVPFSQRTLGNHYRRVAYALRAPAPATPTLRSASHAKTRTAQADSAHAANCAHAPLAHAARPSST